MVHREMRNTGCVTNGGIRRICAIQHRRIERIGDDTNSEALIEDVLIFLHDIDDRVLRAVGVVCGHFVAAIGEKSRDLDGCRRTHGQLITTVRLQSAPVNELWIIWRVALRLTVADLGDRTGCQQCFLCKREASPSTRRRWRRWRRRWMRWWRRGRW